MKNRIVLCADDYGQAPNISKAIIELFNKKRLSATSCLVNTPLWQEHAKWLTPVKSNSDIGLHFNLTEGHALSKDYQSRYGAHFGGLARLLRSIAFKQLDEKIIRMECEAQLDSFIRAMGRLPTFIDGHHHIHQLPIIRQAVIHVFLKHLSCSNAYIRFVQPKLSWQNFSANFKKMFIRLISTNAFKKQLIKHSIPHNGRFSGMYSFKIAANYKQMFPRFINEIQKNGLIMCHPGLQITHSSSMMDKARFAEYSYLNSEQFEQDCRDSNVEIGSFFNKVS